MKTDKIRETFLSFFAERDHRVVTSSPVVPQADPTLLFTNAGMNQFKDVLLGNERRDYARATSSQKCIRAGGKHNDLDEVGRDGRHLTFFEMLGNWSFGDYYKEESIAWAWEFVRGPLDLDPARLYVSVYKDDEEAYQAWRSIGIAPERLGRFGDIEASNEENFWSMGPTGPCGPCTEIYYDLDPGAGPVTFEQGAFDEDRVMEIWNLVFMEFDRDQTGTFHPLPMRSVDTGMGFERVAMVKAGRSNVFHTDLFSPIFERIAQIADAPFADPDELYARGDFASWATIADHARAVTFALSDGASFSNEGRGSVLRSILRRAVRHGRRLGLERPFMHEVAGAVVTHYERAYPELRALADQTRDMIAVEEERFLRTLERGLVHYERAAERAKRSGSETIAGEDLFELHTTYGFPPDMTGAMARDEELDVDRSDYERRLAAFREISRGKDVYAGAQAADWTTVRDDAPESFVGYTDLASETHLRAWRPIPESEEYELLLTDTPFYAESGGQIGDTGRLEQPSSGVRLAILDTQRAPIGLVHRARVEKGSWEQADLEAGWRASIDSERRRDIVANHTATHLLHAALRSIVSESIYQAGSSVGPDKLRFDFRLDRPLSAEEVRAIEERVNDQIRAAHPVQTHAEVERARAVDEMGAMAIFGEKYAELVRVIEIPGVSVELCGGTHARSTSELLLFRIASEAGVAAGVRRIEALTRRAALASYLDDARALRETASLLKCEPAQVPERAGALREAERAARAAAETATAELARRAAAELASSKIEVDGVEVIAARIEVRSRDELVTYAERARDALKSGAVLLAADLDGRPALVCALTQAAIKERGLKAGPLVSKAAERVGGRGGGRPALAQAGGSDPGGIPRALEDFAQIVREALKG